MLPYLYFLKVMICSAIFMGYYYVALRNKIYHQYNRFYLLFAFALSWCIPILPISLSVPKETVSTHVFQAIQYISASAEPFEQNVIVEVAKPILTFNNIVLCFYGIVCFVMLILFIRVLYFLFRLTKKYKAQTFNTCKIYLTQESNTPFSFFKHIFWNTTVDVESAIGKQILQHELTHINEKHSLDKVYVQLNLFIGWFNPFFWLMKKELEMIHEFIADKKSVPNADTELFAQMLLNTAFAGKNISLTNPFFFSPIKRRLTMLTKKPNPKFSYVQRIIALPVLTILVIIFSLKAQGISVKQVINNNLPGTFAIKPNTTETNAAESPITSNTNTFFLLKRKYKVVIDAGHGGVDKGAISTDGKTFEKDIALIFAKTIKAQNKNENIEIVLTRDNDVFQNPKEKAEFVNNQNADLLLSVHCNYAGVSPASNIKSGIEIFVVSKEKDNGFKQESDALATYVNSSLSSDFKSNNIHSRQTGIWVLQATKCPGILIETGFIDNATDLKILKDESKQQLLAKNILSGIEQYLYQHENNTQLQLMDTTIIDRRKNVFEADARLKEVIKRRNELNDATDEEMKEYKQLVEKCTTNSPKAPEKYDFDKLSEKDKDRMFELYNKMDTLQQAEFAIRIAKPMKPFTKEIPTKEQLTLWQNSKVYGVWINEKRVSNDVLSRYEPSNFSYYFTSKLERNAINYGKHYVQIDLMTNDFYKNYLDNEVKRKYVIWFKPNFIKKK